MPETKLQQQTRAVLVLVPLMFLCGFIGAGWMYFFKPPVYYCPSPTTQEEMRTPDVSEDVTIYCKNETRYLRCAATRPLTELESKQLSDELLQTQEEMHLPPNAYEQDIKGIWEGPSCIEGADGVTICHGAE